LFSNEDRLVAADSQAASFEEDEPESCRGLAALEGDELELPVDVGTAESALDEFESVFAKPKLDHETNRKEIIVPTVNLR